MAYEGGVGLGPAVVSVPVSERSAITVDERPVALPRARLVELERASATAGARAWFRAVRVRQWPKNMLVFAAPAVAGMLTRPSVLARGALTFAAFCVLASGVYLLNDAHDAAEDRRHPVKQHRPVATGAIGERTAAIVGAGLLLAGLSVTLLVGWAVFAIAGGYVLLNGAYRLAAARHGR